MQIRTLSKARSIYNAGGVERVGTSAYEVFSTSGERYLVWSDFGSCTCPTPRRSQITCSHLAAVDLYRAKHQRSYAA